MQKLNQFLALAKKEGEVGIEIEVEGNNLPDIANAYWTSVPDNSLRGGKEYIFSKPKKFNAVKQMIGHLRNEFEKHGANLRFSFRTSVHVHVNVQEFTYPQVLNFIYTYLLVEAPLMKYCHPVRSANRFCLRAVDAEGMFLTFTEMFRRWERDGVRSIPEDRMRYAAINVEALLKYGSLEFRALEGNLDVDRISNWCELLRSIRDYSLKMESPAHIYDEFVEIGPDKFIKNIFGELTQHLDVVNADILRSFSLSIDLPFQYRDSLLQYHKEGAIVGKDLSRMVMDEMQKIRVEAEEDREHFVPPLRAGDFIIAGAGVPRLVEMPVGNGVPRPMPRVRVNRI